MRTSRIIPLAAAAALLAALVAGSALAAPGKTIVKPKPVAFTATFSGQASSKLDGTTADLSADGTGTATLIGASKISGTGTADSSQQPCPPFGGTGSIVGAKGTITFTVVSGAKGCGDDGGHNFSLVGYLAVTKATGALANKKGQLRFTGNYGRDDGTFSLKLTGTLK
ncbi:MAG: hypothetical protein JOZ56_06330 [Actinobacteria bacterium]|nr:hypothetical protein [Actinomycetota bacterium]MBV8562690.1 hypothetical protein [Actinomycetota bacterium]